MITEPIKTRKAEHATIKNGCVLKPTQLVHVVEKEWGHEEWIANTQAYCGKKLVFKSGYQCSMHQHKIKDETFYLQSGKIILETDFNEKTETRVMTAGDTAHIVPGMWHRITAITNAEVFEFSTFHMEEDSYRRSTSGKVDIKALGFDKL
jgi:quercetin dioxygenase-like cupin family protein